MLNLTEIKTGKKIIYEDEPYVVMSYTHSKTGRAGAVLRTKMRNLITGSLIDKTFQGADKVSEAEVNKQRAQYLYAQGDDYHFMDMESYDQISLGKDVIGSAANYLIEGTEVKLLIFNDAPINIELPVKVELTVTEAPPGLKGDTQSGGDKLVTLETGHTLTVPLFVNAGDKITINTEKDEYAGKA